MSDADLSPFGRVLRRWRAARGMSQLALATAAATSTRHVSFLETGRAQPSREMVLRLSNALDVPLRERNGLLAAAGFAPLYRESALGEPALGPFARMLEFTLARFEPFPAFLIDRGFGLVRANGAAGTALARFVNDKPVWRAQPPNLLRLTLHPDALQPHIVNFREVAAALLTRLERAVATSGGDAELVALERELRALPGVPDARTLPAAIEPVMPLHLKHGDLEVRLFTMLSQAGSAQDVTAAELHIETLMPADAASEAVLRSLAQS